MKLQTQVALSESQKAQIVARGEVLKTEYTFEMSPKYAATFPQLDRYNAFQVVQDEIKIVRPDNLYITEYRDVDGNRIERHEVRYDFCTAVASGSIKDGASCDPIMQKIVELLDSVILHRVIPVIGPGQRCLEDFSDVIDLRIR